jgi:signal peptidase I
MDLQKPFQYQNTTPSETANESVIVETTLEKQKRGVKSTLSIIGILVSAPLLAIVITIYIFQSYVVFGPSMESSLSNGDRLIVLKAPKTWAKIRGKYYIPRRGEIVVFNRPNAIKYSGDDKQLIKRVIGLPGERVVVKAGKLTVYNKEYPQGFSPDDTGNWATAIKTTPIDTDTIVPENSVFVCGDNRSNSLDSRSFGSIDSDSIVGVATIRFLPLSSMDNI